MTTTLDSAYRDNAKPQEAVYISILLFLVSGQQVRVTNKCYFLEFERVQDCGVRQMQRVLYSKEPYQAGSTMVNVAHVTHVECEILVPETPGSTNLVLHEEFMNRWQAELFMKVCI